MHTASNHFCSSVTAENNFEAIVFNVTSSYAIWSLYKLHELCIPGGIYSVGDERLIGRVGFKYVIVLSYFQAAYLNDIGIGVYLHLYLIANSVYVFACGRERLFDPKHAHRSVPVFLLDLREILRKMEIGRCSIPNHRVAFIIAPATTTTPTVPQSRYWTHTSLDRYKAIDEDGYSTCHDDVIRWKHFRRYLPFVSGIHWSPVDSPHNGHWRETLIFCSMSARAND